MIYEFLFGVIFEYASWAVEILQIIKWSDFPWIRIFSFNVMDLRKDIQFILKWFFFVKFYNISSDALGCQKLGSGVTPSGSGVTSSGLGRVRVLFLGFQVFSGFKNE